MLLVMPFVRRFLSHGPYKPRPPMPFKAHSTKEGFDESPDEQLALLTINGDTLSSVLRNVVVSVMPGRSQNSFHLQLCHGASS